jgi:uncharacterized YigZ family protein
MDQPDPSPDSFPVPGAPAQWEERVERSRFLALVHPIAEAGEAVRLLAQARLEHHKATHHCHAWRTGHPGREPAWGCGDDGEPSGSAGQPILRAIDGSGLSNVLGVVVRWFGGIKLGTGGLARAYGSAATGALASCQRSLVTDCQPLHLRIPYSRMTRVRRLLARHGAREVNLVSGEELQLDIQVPSTARATLMDELREILQGQGAMWTS